MNSFPYSIRQINDLPTAERDAIYRTLIPDWLLNQYGIDPVAMTNEGKSILHIRAPQNSRVLEISVRRYAEDIDPMLYLNMVDTFNNQLLVLLVVVNDPDAPRFNIDRDLDGYRTHLGTSARNLVAEESAMKAGLAPGQVRRGLRVFKQLVPIFEQFVSKMGHQMFFIEPLAYHNAIVFERYGFNYVRGYQDMVSIHNEFQPNGSLHQKLGSGGVFRPADAWQTVRGRAWAIHDGVLGHPFTGFQMVKYIDQDAGISTFPDLVW